MFFSNAAPSGKFTSSTLNCYDKFSISETGELTFNTSPDYENPTDVDRENDYLLSITVTETDSDGEEAKIEPVRVEVTDVNEPPAFDDGETATRSVGENASPGDPIGDPVTATDSDSGDGLTYTLGGADASSFTIVDYSGQLQTSAPLDHETRPSYTVTVTVSDGKDAEGNADTTADDTITVTIDVTGENEPPEFPGQTDTRTVAENTQPGRDIGAPVAATDPDDGDTLTYTLGEADVASFAIVESSGQLQTKAPLDFEDKSIYTVTVTATDGSGATDTIDVTINVTDVNEQPTFDDGETATRTIPENTASGEDIGNPVAATDPDDDTLTYTLDATSAEFFDIIESSGQLQTKTELDKENKATYTVTVSVHDGKNEAGGSDTTVDDSITVTITVTDVNDPPAFSDVTANRSFAENTAANTNIGDPVTATDDDSDTLTYSLEGTDADSFQIVPTSGQIQTKSGKTYDHEAKSSYSVTVKADDGNGGADTIAATITVTDLNEAPTFSGPTTSRTIAENTAAGQSIGDPVTATDPDTGNTVTHTLEGTDAGSFDINGANGQIRTKSGVTYDHEAKSSYSVTVKADDGNGGNDTIAVTINVTDVNEPPAFPSTEDGARSVTENTPGGQEIGSPVTATDPDDGYTLTYTLDGTDAASFDIDASTGQLKTKAELNFESKETYLFSVLVRDSKGDDGSPDTVTDATIPVTINVTDENEPPELTGQTSISYAENRSDAVATYTADDPESGTIDWLVTGTDRDDFSITGGVLTFNSPPNFEVPTDASTDNEYLVTVQASDETNPVTMTVAVTVTDVNEAPAFAIETDTRSVAENTAAGQDIGAPVEATDPDDGDTLTYSLGGTDAASFDIDTSSGQLQTEDALDFETKASYTVTVTASDGSLSDSQEVTITVTDANEPPAFDDVEPATRTIDENTAAGKNIGAPLTATDPDDGATLTYTLGGDDAAFGIDPSSGQLQTSAALDFEAKGSYTVTVSVRDSKADDGTGDSAPDDTITVTVTITNVDEEGTVTLSSVQPQVGTALTATLEDPDGDVTGDTWQWARLPGVNSEWTDIDGATSDSYTPVDDEVGELLLARVSYTDPQGPGKSAQALSQNAVRAAPATNNAPVFTEDTVSSFTIDENTAADTNIGDPVTATDTDDDKLTYSLGGTDATSFTIVPATGQLQTDDPLDYEAKKIYTVTVTATDPSGESDNITVTITVTDVNEAPVVGISASIDYAENRRDRIATYTATDPEGKSITWKLSGDDSEDFHISTGGELTFNTPPDHEAPTDADTNNQYEVTVEAYDGAETGSLPLTITVTNVNEAPVVEGQVSIEYAENGTEPVATYTANDPEEKEITWSLSGADSDDFSITGGELTFNTPPDYEAPADADDEQRISGHGGSLR